MRVSAGAFCDPRQLDAIDELIGESPDDIGLHFGRACCLEDFGRTDEAIGAYTGVLNREPAHFGALTNLGLLLLERGYAREARPYLAAAAEVIPPDPIALLNLARLDAQTGATTGAMAGYTAVLAAIPDSLHAHLGLSELYAQLGDRRRARLHEDRAYARPRMWHYPYRGSATPLKALVLASASGGDIVSNLFFDDQVFQKSVLLADSVRGVPRLPQHHVLFNAISDADRCRPSLEHAQAICAASSAPLVNHPAIIARTGRADVMQLLGRLPAVRAPRTQRIGHDVTPAMLIERGFTFPLLLRSPGHHAGMHLAFVESADALAGVAATLPGPELLAIEYLDARGSDGAVRKYRVISVDGRLYPLHLAIASQWKVHYFSADMADRPDYRAQEAAFLNDMPSAVGERGMRGLAAICATLGLDYCGVDFSLDAHGNILVFEANATMAVYLPDARERWSYRRGAAGRAIAAVRTMLTARALDTNDQVVRG